MKSNRLQYERFSEFQNESESYGTNQKIRYIQRIKWKKYNIIKYRPKYFLWGGKYVDCILTEYDAKEVYGPEITDKDGELLDEHDSFYINTKSLLVLFQIMGVMPIMRVAKRK